MWIRAGYGSQETDAQLVLFPIENLLNVASGRIWRRGASRGEVRLCEIIAPAFLARKRRMEEREAKTAFTPRSRA